MGRVPTEDAEEKAIIMVGGHPLEEGDGGYAAQGLHRAGVHHHGVDDIAHIGHRQHRHQLSQDLRPVFHDHRADQAGHADRRELDDQVHDLHGHLIEAVHHLGGHQPLFPRQQDAEAHQERDDDDLEHGGIGQRRDGVGGEDVDDGLHQRLARGGS